jgi:tryptophan-rich sensory protein
MTIEEHKEVQGVRRHRTSLYTYPEWRTKPAAIAILWWFIFATIGE